MGFFLGWGLLGRGGEAGFPPTLQALMPKVLPVTSIVLGRVWAMIVHNSIDRCSGNAESGIFQRSEPFTCFQYQGIAARGFRPLRRAARRAGGTGHRAKTPVPGAVAARRSRGRCTGHGPKS